MDEILPFSEYTATDELEGRIETLGRTIERMKTQRTQAVDTVKLCESNIKRATTLRNEYQAILNATRP